MRSPRLVLLLSENHTLVPARDLRALVDIAVDAERAGFDGVMVSEHVVLGRGADADGLPENPRDYALPENQDPATPWPSSLLLLAAVASVTTDLRLIASAVIPPLRHPLLVAKEIATLDLLSRGRLVVQPTVSWHRAEYEALGVPFGTRGERLDEHLQAWARLWRASPTSYHGAHYAFDDVWLEPKPFRPEGPRLWFGGQRLHDRLLGRLVAHGHGFNPLGRPSDDDLARLGEAMHEAGRDAGDLEMVGGTRGSFPDPLHPATLDGALDQIPEQVARGFGTICVKPSQFIDDPREVPSLLRRIVDGVAARCA
ncbi:MAG: TIGR03619 family F420-dependent LLM class oxidoreductase [Actinomycetota bacterium]